jgi:hypothetical protein
VRERERERERGREGEREVIQSSFTFVEPQQTKEDIFFQPIKGFSRSQSYDFRIYNYNARVVIRT